jgi:hypothetical protein
MRAGSTAAASDRSAAARRADGGALPSEPQRRTTRAVIVIRIRGASGRVCPESLQRIANFSPEFSECDSLKNRCRWRKINSIGQVVACRILTVHGEVAERLKAAVC